MEAYTSALPAFDPTTARRPILVAHRGGHHTRALRAAIDAGVDWVEVDVWWHHRRLVVRHDPALWRLPVTYDGWRMRVALRPFPTLDRLLDLLADTPVRLLLDLKGTLPEDTLGKTFARTAARHLLRVARTARELPRALVETLRRRQAVARAAVCGQQWAPLDAARALEPALPVFFSLGTEEHITAYLRRLQDGTALPLISIRHSLLTAERVADLRDRGVTMVAWTVNDYARARELIGWGVDGITSDSLVLLQRLRDLAPHST
jgi:glycerophosphoryl diester phosphodiesterase